MKTIIETAETQKIARMQRAVDSGEYEAFFDPTFGVGVREKQQPIRNLVRAIAQASLVCTRWETKVMLASYQEGAR